MKSQAAKDVEAALPDEFTTARELWKRMGMWSPGTVRGYLNQLHALGKAERITRNYDARNPVHLYRRVRTP